MEVEQDVVIEVECPECGHKFTASETVTFEVEQPESGQDPD